MIHCDLLIIGGGMAAASLVLELSRIKQPPKTCVLSRENCFGYNRVLLPDYLSGHCKADALTERISHFKSLEWLEVFTDANCESLNIATKTAQTPRGPVHFKRLVFATGAAPNRPNIDGIDLPGVHTLRTLEDAITLKSASTHIQHCVVLGGGLLGLEAADAMQQQGVDVTIVHRGPHLMNKQLDPKSAELLSQHMTQNGITIRTSSAITQISGRSSVERVEINHEAVKADCVLLACGTIARDSLAKDAGLPCASGIQVNNQLEAQAGIFAIGECARISGNAYSYVEAAFEQAAVIARQHDGQSALFKPAPQATHLKVSNIALFAAGEITYTPDHELTIESDSGALRRHLAFQGTKLVSAVLLGDLTGSNAIRHAMGQQLNSPQSREKLAFGI